MSTEKLTAEQLLDKQIADKVAELKKKHSLTEVFSLKVDDKVAYLKKPNRKDLSMARSLGGNDEIAIAALILDAIWLEGDEVIKTDDDYFLNVIPYINGLIEVKTVELKKN